MKVIFIDFETNGFSAMKNSALSVYALSEDGRSMERFYLIEEGEEYNKKAEEVHGLTESVLLEKRANVEYSEFCKDDSELAEFVGEHDLFVSYNVPFDWQWLPCGFADMYYMSSFCPMRFLTDYIRLPKKKGNGYKFPNLREAAEFLGVEVDEDKRHNAKYDVELLEQIFYRIKEEYPDEWQKHIVADACSASK
jgi:DNA polymerase III epsilon subunit-like protein